MADIILNITIPEEHTIKVLQTLTLLAGKQLRLEAFLSSSSLVEWGFKFLPRGDTEPAKDFGERVIREFLKAAVKMVDYAEDRTRYDLEVSQIPPASQDVPEDIFL